MLLTLDDLRTLYGFSFPKSQDEAYAALLATAEERVLSYAEIEQGEVEEYFPAGKIFVLTHLPVLSVESVKVSGQDIEYRFEKRPNAVILSSEPESEVVVSYSCGWAEGNVPETIKTAIAFTVQHLMKLSSGKLLGINSRSTEGGTETIEQSVPPLAVQKMLEPYRRNKVL